MRKNLKNDFKRDLKVSEVEVVEEERIHNKWYKDKGFWSEFDGVYHANKSEKKYLEKSELKIYDFKFYSIERIKKDFEYGLWEKVSMFLTVLYDEHYNGYHINEWKRTYFLADRLRMLLGKNYDKIVDRLDELGVIDLEKKENKNNVYQYCWYVGLKKEFWEVEGEIYCKRDMISEKFQESILNYGRKRKVKTKLEKHIEKVLDKCSIDLGNKRDKIDKDIANEKYKEEVSKLESDNVSNREKAKLKKQLENKNLFINNRIKLYREYYERLMTKLNSEQSVRRGFYNIRVSDYGYRLSHIISNMPKRYRKELKIDKDDVLEVDIVSSQAAFLTILMNKWLNSEEKFKLFDKNPWIAVDRLEMIYSKDSRMDLYRFMTYKLYGFKAMFDKKMRDEMKLMFMGLFFDKLRNAEYRGQNKRKLINKIFGPDFYELIDFITKLNVEGIETEKHRNLNALLNREESKFLNEVMDKLMKDNVLFLPLYDCLIVKKSDEVKVKEAFNLIISKNGYDGIVKVK